MTPTKLLIGQILFVFVIVLAGIWAATQWAAAKLAYQPELGPAWIVAFGQATNQLLALVAKQQFQIENMMAAQYRAQAIDQARALQAQSDAHAAAAKFLGSGSAYTPQ